MEEHQIKHILQNKEQLIAVTSMCVNVTTSLNAQGILTKADVQRIEAKKRNEGDLAAAELFYDIVLKKKDSYEILITVFKKNCFTGVVKILEDINLKSSKETKNGSLNAQNNEGLHSMTIGIEDCHVRISEILKIARNSETTLIMLQTEWENIGIKLEIPVGLRDTWRKEVMLGISSMLSIFERLLAQWCVKQGKGATFGKLLDAVKNCGMKSFSDELEITFASKNQVDEQ